MQNELISCNDEPEIQDEYVDIKPCPLIEDVIMDDTERERESIPIDSLEIKQEEQLIGFENEQDEGHVECSVAFEPTIQTFKEGEHQRKEESIEDTQTPMIEDEVQVKREEPLELIDDPSSNKEGVDVLNELLEDDSGDERDNEDINPGDLEEAGRQFTVVC